MFALLLQVISAVLLRHRLGKTWLRRPGTLLVLTSALYLGLSPALMSIGSVGKWDAYRKGVQQPYVDEATLIMSAAMLAFTLAYLLTQPQRVMAVPQPADIGGAARALDWRLLALGCLPLAALTYAGRGYNGSLTTGAGAPVVSSLADGLFVIGVVLAAFALVLRHGSRWFLPALVTQSVLLAAAGERTPVIADAIVLGVLLASCGLRPPASQLRAAAALTLILVLALTGARARQGREVFSADSSLGTRVAALGGEVTSQATAQGPRPGLLAQAASRLDGTDFAGAVLQAEHQGRPALAAAGVGESLLIAVPSAAWPSKLARGLALNPTLAELDDFGLQQVNFLPGLTGLYTGFLPWPWQIALLAALGALCGHGERWLTRRCTPARMVLLAGAVTAALRFEQGLPGMLVSLRAAIAIAVIAWLAARLRRPRPEASIPGPQATASALSQG